MDERKTSRSRRRASRILAEKRRKGPPVSCDDESPTRERAKPPRRKKKEALYEEDIIEGFAILSYIKYEDIEVSLNGGKPPKKKGTTNNSTNGVVTEPKVPEVIIKQEEPPAPPLSVKVNHVDKTNQDPSTSDDSGREKEKIKREVAVIKRDPESEDNRVSDASSRCSSGRGYLCDSEDDDKNSDSGSVLFSASPPAVRKLDVANEAVNGHGGGGERVPGAGITVKSNGSPRPPSPAAPPPPLALALPPQQPHPPPKPSPNHFSPVSIPNGVTTKVERVSPPPASMVSAHSGHHRVVPPPAPAPPPVAYSLPSRPGYPPGYPLPQPPHAHSLPPHPLPGHSQPPHPHPQPSPTACAPTPPSVPAPPPVSAYHPPLYAPYNSTPYLPPTSLHQPSRSPIGLKPITTSVGLVVTTATTTTSHRDTINAPLIGRTHSPRGHSPTRERDSYSSNVSSLSRGSMGTPSSMPPYSAPHHPSVVPPVASVVAPSAQPSSLPYKQPSPWVSSSNPPQPTAPGRTGLTPHHHPFAPPMFPPNPVAAPPVSSAPAPPPAPNPFSAESLFQSNQGDLLRRELDSRFLATQDRGPYIRTEMHHHQHQHTHVHQHTTPIIPPPPPTLFSSPMVNFKDMPKGAPVDSPFYRQSLGFSGYPSYTPSLIHPSFGSATPFAPPTHLPTFTPKQLTEPSKPKTVKTGKWNAMHVRVAWEIYHHQQKSGGGEGKVGPLIGKSDFMRPPTHMFGPPPPHPFTAPTHPHRTVQQAYDPTPSHTFPPTMGSSVFGRYPPAGPTFPTALPSFPHAPAIHDPWGRIQPRGVPPQGFPPPSPWGLKPEVMDEREREKERERSRERERQRREEKQRQRMVGVPSKVRDRSPLREPPPQAHPMLPATTVSKEEEAAMISRTQHYLAARQPPRPLPPHFPQSPWDPYRYDPLRYNPLMAALQEEEQRAKLFGYGGAPPPSLAHLRSKAPSPSHRLPPAPHGAHPKDDPTQPR